MSPGVHLDRCWGLTLCRSARAQGEIVEALLRWRGLGTLRHGMATFAVESRRRLRVIDRSATLRPKHFRSRPRCGRHGHSPQLGLLLEQVGLARRGSQEPPDALPSVGSVGVLFLRCSRSPISVSRGRSALVVSCRGRGARLRRRWRRRLVDRNDHARDALEVEAARRLRLDEHLDDGVDEPLAILGQLAILLELKRLIEKCHAADDKDISLVEAERTRHISLFQKLNNLNNALAAVTNRHQRRCGLLTKTGSDRRAVHQGAHVIVREGLLTVLEATVLEETNMCAPEVIWKGFKLQT